MLYVVLAMPTLNKAYLLLFIYMFDPKYGGFQCSDGLGMFRNYSAVTLCVPELETVRSLVPILKRRIPLRGVVVNKINIVTYNNSYPFDTSIWFVFSLILPPRKILQLYKRNELIIQTIYKSLYKLRR
jgi:hypothetical protein